MGEVKGKRQYRSAVRAESARRTRRAVVAAAAELFVVKGYAATSLADVAVAAGVARPTVFAAFGSKPALLRQVLDQALAGDDEPVPVAERPWFAPVWQAATAGALLVAYADVCLVIARRAARLFETTRRAADDAEDIAELWRTLCANRRVGAAMVVRRAAELTPLPDEPRAVDLVWLLNDPAHYAALVLDSGWPEERYRDWLAAALREAVLQAPG
ncbi:TetR family transcriptional regulator [Dactylosporangium roseum]|uniref:TetR family transcriptional regulator n=1 Tax=Dactylosporangium roseum TaxID=47989 RepID=A0ABY5YVA2_9ACTN|nr:TetR family transcriptional regulator [Dactylosporangium roseum]UWZ33668.1 TetR family transcriptional regulator [Dactylosporangium roseum]